MVKIGRTMPMKITPMNAAMTKSISGSASETAVFNGGRA